MKRNLIKDKLINSLPYIFLCEIFIRIFYVKRKSVIMYTYVYKKAYVCRIHKKIFTATVVYYILTYLHWIKNLKNFLRSQCKSNFWDYQFITLFKFLSTIIVCMIFLHKKNFFFLCSNHNLLNQIFQKRRPNEILILFNNQSQEYCHDYSNRTL